LKDGIYLSFLLLAFAWVGAIDVDAFLVQADIVGSIPSGGNAANESSALSDGIKAYQFMSSSFAAIRR